MAVRLDSVYTVAYCIDIKPSKTNRGVTMYRITVTYTAGTVPTRVVEVNTKAQAENVVNAINDAILATGNPTGGIAARWYDLTWYLGSVENAVTIKTERVAKTKVA